MCARHAEMLRQPHLAQKHAAMSLGRSGMCIHGPKCMRHPTSPVCLNRLLRQLVRAVPGSPCHMRREREEGGGGGGMQSISESILTCWMHWQEAVPHRPRLCSWGLPACSTRHSPLRNLQQLLSALVAPWGPSSPGSGGGQGAHCCTASRAQRRNLHCIQALRALK